MTTEAWDDIVPDLAKGIRALPVVREHKDWWFCLCLDGFESHLSPYSRKVFAKHKIFVVKEEGDSSQTNQAYDQSVAKWDKKLVSEGLSDFKTGGGKLDQLSLCTIVARQISKTPPDAWVKLFIKVNLHPNKKIPFDEWIKKIAGQLEGEHFLKKGDQSFYRAMPAIWKKMKPELRHEIYSTINSFYDKHNGTGLDVWGDKECILALAHYVPLKEIPKLRACYYVCKKDESVLDRTQLYISNEQEEKEIANDKKKDGANYYKWAIWNHHSVLNPYMEEKSTKNKNAFFNHITNFIARSHWNKTNQDLLPSQYLNVEFTEQQKTTLNPSLKDVVRGQMIHETVGKGAIKKLAKRRLDMIDSNIASYSRILNCPEQLERLRESKALNELLALLNEEKQLKAEKKAAERREEEKKKAQKKMADELEYAAKKIEMYPTLLEMMKHGKEHIKMLTNQNLKDIHKYFFDEPTPKVSNMKKSGLIDELLKRWTEVDELLKKRANNFEGESGSI